MSTDENEQYIIIIIFPLPSDSVQHDLHNIDDL